MDKEEELTLRSESAAAVLKIISKVNCDVTYRQDPKRIEYFKGRLVERGLPVDDWLVIVANVDDPHGEAIAHCLMPDYDWEPYRKLGQTPYARGLAGRKWVEEVLEIFDTEAAEKLKNIKSVVPVVVVDFGVAEIYT